MSARTAGLDEELNRLCAEALRLDLAAEDRERVEAVPGRLGAPLRVAIAGRAKAGKSTLLNALVGESLAASDAGECTRIVTWYEQGSGYRVAARLRDGERQDLRFRRETNELQIDLAGHDEADIDYLSVEWPTSRLADVSYIDTPGLASISTDVSARTIESLVSEADEPGDCDAVVYLMRHAHGRDSEFLEAFQERTVAHAAPVNAVAVLSRPDELGGGRLDAMSSAARIARRYAADERVQSLVATVVPVSGLIALTGETLQEREMALLQKVAGLEAPLLADALLSVDRFRHSAALPLEPSEQEELLRRFGLYGLRFVVSGIRSGKVSTATALSRELTAVSGIEALRQFLREHFARRARALKARSALAVLCSAASNAAGRGDTRATPLLANIERIEASATEFARLRLLHLALTGAANLRPEEKDEMQKISSDEPPLLDFDDVPAHILGRIGWWRNASSDPLASPARVEACELAARVYEHLYASAAGSAGPY